MDRLRPLRQWLLLQLRWEEEVVPDGEPDALQEPTAVAPGGVKGEGKGWTQLRWSRLEMKRIKNNAQGTYSKCE